jgi:hypothetical protein
MWEKKGGGGEDMEGGAMGRIENIGSDRGIVVGEMK